jgi:hypothetical protein
VACTDRAGSAFSFQTFFPNLIVITFDTILLL